MAGRSATPEQSIPGAPPPTGPRRRVTLAELAAEAGVSSGLVSLILRGEPGPSAATAARVMEVAERLGYRANRTASQLARRRTRSIGVTMTPGNPYHGEFVEEILARADARGYEVVLGPVTPTHAERSTIESLVDSGCEALVLLNSLLADGDLERLVHGVPTVVVGRPLDLPGVDVVRTADTRAMSMLVRHLASHGHTRIAHVDGGQAVLPAERRRGYLAAMRRLRLDPLVLPGGETEEAGRAAARLLDDHPDVTAVVAYNDLCAVGILDHLHGKGVRVPDDIAVTGFDDDRLAAIGPISLTTINPSAREQAQLAVDAAVERLDGGRSERVEHVVAPRLVARRSSNASRR